MSLKPIAALEVRSRLEWRAWLRNNHVSSSGIWLVFRKRRENAAVFAYDDAVEEALCFGWVDSLVRRMDDATYARKFTPRKADSKWSTIGDLPNQRLRSVLHFNPLQPC